MLQLLLTILKILGIIVLVILGIILAVLLIVLLVPVRYRGDVSFDGKPRGGVLVSWLLRFVTVRLDYDGSVLRALVKVLWFRLFDQTLWPSEKVEEPLVQPGVQSSVTAVDKPLSDPLAEDEFFVDMTVTDPGEENPAETNVPKQVEAVEETLPKQEEVAEKTLPDPVEKTEVSAKAEPVPEKKQAETSGEAKKPFLEVFAEKLQSTVIKLADKAKTLYNSLTGKYVAGQEKVALVREFLGNADNQNTIRLIWQQVIKIIKHILPTKLRGRVKFGFDDPATTGQILTYISPFYGVYAKTVTIEPVFDEKVMEGELHLKGRIRLGTLLWNVVRVFLNKNFRTLLKRLLKRSK